MESEDSRNRPIILQTQGSDQESVRRGPARYFAWAGTGVIALAAAVGVIAGGTAVWSAVDPGTPGQSPAPLWFPQPTVEPQAATTTPDDHGGRRDDPTKTPSSAGTTEPGDDKGGSRTTEPGDDKGGNRTTTEPGDDKGGNRSTEPGDDKGGSGKGSDNSGSGTSGKN
jgi:hypothetical protein